MTTKLDELELLWKRRHQPATCTTEQHDEAKHEFIRCMDDAFPALSRELRDLRAVRDAAKALGTGPPVERLGVVPDPNAPEWRVKSLAVFESRLDELARALAASERTT